MLGMFVATIPMKILSIIGIILLAVLALFLGGLLLFLFFPFTYRVSGSKNGEGLKLAVKVNWLFGLFRVRFRYPEPGRLTAKVLFFTLFDSRIPPDPEEKGDGRKRKRKSTGKKLSGFWKKRQAKKNKKKTGDSPKDSGQGYAAENGKSSDAPKSGQENGRRAFHGRSAFHGKAKESSGSRATPGQDMASSVENEDKPDNCKDAAEKANDSASASISDSAGAESTDTSGNANDSTASAANGADSEESTGKFSKFSKKIQKIKYTICSIYDKIKKIWKNISCYIELLQKENTKQLAAHAMQRGIKVMKSVGPRHVRAEIVFGAGSPDTTGYLFGGYCVLASVFGTSFQVTPDFEQKRFEGEFDISGHVIVWVLAMNGLKLLFDRKLRVFLRGLKAAQKKASA